MKAKFSILALLAVTLCGCYEVPDDFPKADFYSYAPYQEGDIVRFCHEKDTIAYIVTSVAERYNRGKTNCKCGKESVAKDVSFQRTASEKGPSFFSLSIYCADRAYFTVSLMEFYNILADYTDEDIWSISYDESKIFKAFTDVIILLQNDKPMAQIKKKEGIVWFVDSNGTQWTASK